MPGELKAPLSQGSIPYCRLQGPCQGQEPIVRQMMARSILTPINFTLIQSLPDVDLCFVSMKCGFRVVFILLPDLLEQPGNCDMI